MLVLLSLRLVFLGLTMLKYYTGVGSRNVPANIGRLMTITATFLESKGYTLRSGGAARK